MDLKTRIKLEMTNKLPEQEEAIAHMIKVYGDKKPLTLSKLTYHLNNCWYAPLFVERDSLIIDGRFDLNGKFAVKEEYLPALALKVADTLKRSGKFMVGEYYRNGDTHEIKQPEQPAEVTTEQVKTVVANLKATPLNREDLVTVLNHKTKLSRRKINTVIDSIQAIAKQYSLN